MNRFHYLKSFRKNKSETINYKEKNWNRVEYNCFFISFVAEVVNLARKRTEHVMNVNRNLVELIKN